MFASIDKFVSCYFLTTSLITSIWFQPSCHSWRKSNLVTSIPPYPALYSLINEEYFVEGFVIYGITHKLRISE